MNEGADDSRASETRPHQVFARGYFVEIPALSERRAMTVAEFFILLWRMRGRIAVATAISALAFISVSYLIPDRYRATVVMLPTDSGSQGRSVGALAGRLGGLASLAGANLGASNSLKNEGLEILQSRSFIEQFIEDRSLTSQILDQHSIEKLWGVLSGEPTVGEAYRVFVGDVLNVQEEVTTGVLELSVTWHDPTVVAQWANALYESLNGEIRERSITQAERSLEFLQKELQRTSIEGVRTAIYGLIEEQIKNVMLANVNEEFAFRLIDRAHVPERWEKVSPIRLLWALSGALLGFLVAIVIFISPRMTGMSASKVITGR